MEFTLDYWRNWLIWCVSKPIANIKNMSMTNGCLPGDWKTAHISHQSTSIRETKMRLSHFQHGFNNKRSTITQLFNFVDKCCESMAVGKVVDCNCIYFDFAKAFDTVPHKRLLKKLDCYGVKNSLLRRTFSTRKCQWKVIFKRTGNQWSTPRERSRSLVVCHLHQRPPWSSVSDHPLFADNTKLFQEVNTMDEWTHLWLLRFHPEKYKLLTLEKMENIKHAHRYHLGKKGARTHLRWKGSRCSHWLRHFL